MQCPACHVDAVSGAAFCNNCGAALPLVCHQCAAANPPLSRFCIRCGTAIQAAGDATDPPAPRQHGPTLRDVATDTRILAVDIARYSAPRIKTASIATARTTRRFAVYTALRVKIAATAITQRARRPEEPPSQDPVPEDNPPPAPTPIPPPAAPTPLPSHEPRAADTPPPTQLATTCPRCHAVNQAGSLFCFNCGLPQDEVAPATTPRQYQAGRPAGFGIRLAAALVDVVIVTVVQLCLIAVWPGLPEYFDSDAPAPLGRRSPDLPHRPVPHDRGIGLVHHGRQAGIRTARPEIRPHQGQPSTRSGALPRQRCLFRHPRCRIPHGCLPV